jgi:hypothetical protein
MYAFKVIHKLIDKLNYANFSQIAMRFIANEPHCKNV